MRLVRRYWDILGKKNKKTFISRTFAYHGSTMASASLGGMEAMDNQGDLPLPGFVHVMPPYQYIFEKHVSEEKQKNLFFKENSIQNDEKSFVRSPAKLQYMWLKG